MKKTILLALLFSITACQQQSNKSESTAQTNTVKGCSKDLKVCDDGQTVGRDHNNQCEFFDCPAPREVTACPEDMKQCPDGSFVYRNQNNQCAFEACPEQNDSSSKPNREPNKGPKEDPMMCTQDVKRCPDGSFVGRDSYKKCAFKPCLVTTDPADKPEPMMCTEDVKQCGDGTYVSRDPLKNCAFKPCPDGKDTE